MRPIRIVLAVAVVTATIVAGQSWGSWGQVDGSTGDRDTKTLTDRASASFLHATIIVATAFRTLDEGKFEEAGEIGMSAAEALNNAGETFGAVEARLSDNEQVRTELDAHLKGLDFKARRAMFNDPQGQESDWNQIEAAIGRGLSVGLYGEATRRIRSLEGRCREFFAPLQERGEAGYKPIEGARLLAQLGEEIQFGAYVSGLFIKEQ